MIACKEATSQSLHGENTVEKIFFHAFDICLLIIVLLSANWTTLFITL
jgi:hypothetical protein